MKDLLITCREPEGIERNYVPAVRRQGWTGGIRIVTPKQAPVDGSDFQGILLSGGRDIHPRYWDTAEPVHAAAEPDPERDELEMRVVQTAWLAGVPILGICRGIQTLNVALGGSLVQDIHDFYACPPENHRCASDEAAGLCHRVAVDSQARLAAFLQSTRVAVNSRHHQAVRVVAPELMAVAHDPGTHRDGQALIEAVEARDPGRWAIGVQWHPENLVVLDHAAGEAARGLFAAFVRALVNG